MGTNATFGTGTFEIDGLTQLVNAGHISASGGIRPEQIQPASLDPTIDIEAYRMPGSILPLPGESVRELVRNLALERLDLSTAVCLGRDQVYLVLLRERFALPKGVEAYANGKSSTGRVDLATRVLADGSPRYDRIPDGYTGELWLELIPRSFNVVAQAGVSLNQAIFFSERHILSQKELQQLHHQQALLLETDGRPSTISAIVDGR
jgi:dCTP deaminase